MPTTQTLPPQPVAHSIAHTRLDAFFTPVTLLAPTPPFQTEQADESSCEMVGLRREKPLFIFVFHVLNEVVAEYQPNEEFSSQTQRNRHDALLSRT